MELDTKRILGPLVAPPKVDEARNKYNVYVKGKYGEIWINDAPGKPEVKEGDWVDVVYYLKKDKYPTVQTIKQVEPGTELEPKGKKGDSDDRARLIVRQTALKVAGVICAAVVGGRKDCDNIKLDDYTIQMAREFEKYILEG